MANAALTIRHDWARVDLEEVPALMRAPSKQGPGTVGVSVEISTTTIQADDFIVVDEDGAVTIPSTNIHNIKPKLDALFTKDRLIQDRVASGATKPPNFENLFNQASVHWIT